MKLLPPESHKNSLKVSSLARKMLDHVWGPALKKWSNFHVITVVANKTQ